MTRGTFAWGWTWLALWGAAGCVASEQGTGSNSNWVQCRSTTDCAEHGDDLVCLDGACSVAARPVEPDSSASAPTSDAPQSRRDASVPDTQSAETDSSLGMATFSDSPEAEPIASSVPPGPQQRDAGDTSPAASTLPSGSSTRDASAANPTLQDSDSMTVTSDSGSLGVPVSTLPATSSAVDAGAANGAPIVDGQFELWPGREEVPRCDLGGVTSDIRVCLPRESVDDGCSQLNVSEETVIAAAEANFDCGSSWAAGITCGPVSFTTDTGPACCWDINGTCETDAEVLAPDFPIVQGEFELWQGSGGQPQCDLGGGKVAVRSCLPVADGQLGCSGLSGRTSEAMSAASMGYLCGEAWNYPWSAGIACGPVLTTTDTGEACCWDLDGVCQGSD